MTGKAFTENVDVSHDEKETAQAELAHPAGRCKSVALNIIENPLKVRFVMSDLLSLSEIIEVMTLILFPPQRKSLEQTVTDARVFADSHGTAEHADFFVRAALVVRD
jgi:hypothetical protein